MSRPDSRFIQKLTKSQVLRLAELRDHGGKKRIRQRAHAILLSFEEMTIIEIANVFQCARNTVTGSIAGNLKEWTVLVTNLALVHPRSSTSRNKFEPLNCWSNLHKA